MPSQGLPDVDPNSGVSVGELSRLVRDVLVRFEGLAARLETQFVRSDNFELYKQLVDQALRSLQDASAGFASKNGTADKFKDIESDIAGKVGKSDYDALCKRVADLEDDKKWLIRLVLGFVFLGVLGAVYTVSRAGGGG